MAGRNVSIFIDIVKGSQFAAGLKAIDTVTAGVAAIAGVMKDAAVESIKLAGDFQVTTNSLAVFTGSVRLAKQELGEIAELSKSTAGLRLVDAEQGYQRLRALGFESKIAKGFIKELGEEKLLSGASDEALSKIIFNFTQIASGGQKVSQELREILTQMPSMKRAFFEAFGTLDPKKIQSFFDKDTDAAFQKLTDAMANAKVPAGGLNDALGKLSDEFILTGRTFGEPILDPLTESVKELSLLINQNRDGFADWGRETGDIISGLNEKYKEFRDYLKENPIVLPVGNGEAAKRGEDIYKQAGIGKPFALSMGEVNRILGTDFQSSAERGAAERLKKDLANPKQNIGTDPNSIFDFGLERSRQFETKSEIQAREIVEEEKRLQNLEKAQKRELTLLKLNADESEKILKNRFDIEQAILDSNYRYTAKEEIKFLTDSGKAKNDFLHSEIGRVTGFYNKQIELQSGNDEEVQKLESEKNKTLSGLNTELRLNAVKTFNEIQQQEIKSYEDRRKAAIDFSGLLIRETESNLDRQTFNITRRIERESSLSVAGFDQLKTLTQANHVEILQLTREQYKQQLEDLSLTDEQRTNIVKETYLTEQDLAEKNRRDILRIEDDKRQQQLEKIQSFFQDLNSILDNQSANSSAILGSIFKFDNLSGRGLNQLLNSPDFTSTKSDFESLTKTVDETNIAIFNNRTKLAELEKQQKSGEIVGETYAGILNIINGEHGNLTDELDKARFSIFELNQKGLLPIIPTVEKFRAALAANPNDVTIFDQIEKDLFEADKANKLARVLSDIFAATAKVKNSVGKAQEDAQKELQSAKNAQNSLDIEFDSRERERYAGSLEGLRQRVKDLQTDEVARAFVVREANKDLYGEIGSLISENIALESKFYQNAELLAEQRKNKLLQYERDVFELRQELSQKSEFSAIEAQAKILSHLERNTKSTTDIFADSFISAFDKIAGYSDKILDKSGIGKIPILGDIAKAQSKNLLSNVTRGLLDNIFPNLSKEFEKTGNPQLDEARRQSKTLDLIERNTRGGGASSILDTSTRPRIVGDLLKPVTGGGGLFGGASSTNPLIYHATGAGGVPPTGTINANGEFVVNGNERSGGIGSMLGNLKKTFGTGEGGLFAARKNLLNGKMSGSAGIAGGIGSLASIAGGLIGGRAGGVLSMAGMGAQIGANFGPWGALIGAGAGALFGFLKGRGGDAKKKLKQAAQSAYGVNISDDNLLRQLQTVGEGYFGKGQAGARASEIVQLEESRNLIEAYASRTGQNTKKLNARNIGNENWSGNQFGTKFGGFAQPTVSSVINQRRPELYAPINYGSVSASYGAASYGASATAGQSGREQMMMDAIVTLTDAVSELRGSIKSIPTGELVALGLKENPSAAADAVQLEFGSNPNRTEQFFRNTGQAF